MGVSLGCSARTQYSSWHGGGFTGVGFHTVQGDLRIRPVPEAKSRLHALVYPHWLDWRMTPTHIKASPKYNFNVLRPKYNLTNQRVLKTRVRVKGWAALRYPDFLRPRRENKRLRVVTQPPDDKNTRPRKCDPAARPPAINNEEETNSIVWQKAAAQLSAAAWQAFNEADQLILLLLICLIRWFLCFKNLRFWCLADCLLTVY